MRNVETPIRSAAVYQTVCSKPSASEAESLMGNGGTKKRRLPAERPREFITGQIEVNASSRKAADVVLVDHPKFIVKAANRRES